MTYKFHKIRKVQARGVQLSTLVHLSKEKIYLSFPHRFYLFFTAFPVFYNQVEEKLRLLVLSLNIEL
jgi:hypothetical protein